MMRDRFLSILLLLILNVFPSLSWGEDPAQDTYSLLSLTEEKEPDAIHLVLEFLPVTTMDEVGNREMSLTIAFFHAEDALSKHFKKPKGVSFSAKMYNILKFEPTVCRIEFKIPRNSIADAVQVRKDAVAAVIKREKSYHPTETSLKDFRSSCFRDLRIAEAFYYDAVRKCNDIRTLKRDIRKSFDALITKIDNDDSLFISEKTDLKNKAEKIRDFLLEKADSKKGKEEGEESSVDCKKNLKLVSKFIAGGEYEKLLLSNPVVLTTQGCWILKGNNKTYLIAVGSARATDETPRLKLKKIKIAETELMSEIAKFRNTRMFTAAEITKSRTGTTINGKSTTSSKRDFSSSTHTVSESHMSNMEKIGQWYSADKSVFFLAQGCVISEE